jgi:hypothetical protein
MSIEQPVGMGAEKEWISFGHQFCLRNGHIQDGQGKQRAPIFLQFMDCVYQLVCQFPSAFEFNEAFLVYIMDQVYTCMFGTFILDNDKAREDENLRVKTISLWSLLPSFQGS